MHRDGQLAMEYQRTHHPTELAAIPDPERFFTTAGEEIAATVSTVREQLLGPRRAGETAEEFRRRSSQASATAEELVLADDHLLTATSSEAATDDPTEDDPDLAAYHRDLAAANDAIQHLYE